MLFNTDSGRTFRRFVDEATLRARTARLMEKLRSVALHSGAKVIDPFPYLCADGRCPTVKDGEPVYKDDSHLRPFYARERAIFIDDTLLLR